MKTKIIEIIKRTNLAKHKGFTDSIFIIVDYQVPKEWNKKKEIKILTKNSTINPRKHPIKQYNNNPKKQ